jgi:hypothetical protein
MVALRSAPTRGHARLLAIARRWFFGAAVYTGVSTGRWTGDGPSQNQP